MGFEGNFPGIVSLSGNNLPGYNWHYLPHNDASVIGMSLALLAHHDTVKPV